MENAPFEDVYPIKHGDIPANYVSLPEGMFFCFCFINHSNRLQSTRCQVDWSYRCSSPPSHVTCSLKPFLGSSGSVLNGGVYSNKTPEMWHFGMSPQKWMFHLGWNVYLRLQIWLFLGYPSWDLWEYVLFFCFCMWVLTLNFCCRFWHHPGSVIIVLDQIEEGVTGTKTRMVVSIWSWNRWNGCLIEVFVMVDMLCWNNRKWHLFQY